MSALSTRSRPSPRLWNLREGSSPALLGCLRPGWGRQGGWRDTWLCHHHTSIRTADTRVTMFANWNLHQCLSPALLCLPDKVFILETNAHDTPFWLHHSRFLWIYFLLFCKQNDGHYSFFRAILPSFMRHIFSAESPVSTFCTWMSENWLVLYVSSISNSNLGWVDPIRGSVLPVSLMMAGDWTESRGWGTQGQVCSEQWPGRGLIIVKQ